MTRRFQSLFAFAVGASLLAAGCGGSSPPPAQPPQQPGPYYAPAPGPYAGGPQGPYTQYPPQQQPQRGPMAQAPQPSPQSFPPQSFPPQQQQQQPQQRPASPAPAPSTTGPFGLPFPFPIPGLGGGTASPTGVPTIPGFSTPLVGTEMQKSETASILQELTQNLAPDRQARVRGIPLVFDPNPDEINAFAGCDDRGAPFMAGTVGLLDAVDAISQTKATDQIFGTQTYEAYLKAALPRLQQPNGGSAALPQGIISPQQAIDPRRLARQRELFDEIIAFAFGHELAHHYMGHTGCANGQAAGGGGPDPSAIARLATRVIPLLNQPVETQADTEGTFNVLNTGKARRARGTTKWSEEGGLILLDFFSRLDGIPLFHPIGFLSTHPNSRGRILWVQGVARTWALQNPGG